MDIPKQLKQQQFIILKNDTDDLKQKIPAEKGWTKDKNYSFSEISNKNLLKYGVMCGINNLIVIDCDDINFQIECLKNPIFKNTFIVKTAGKGLYHFYFYVDEERPKGLRLDVFTEEGKKRVADIQGIGTQVLGPGSVLNNGKEYEVVNNVDIETIKLDELINLCKNMVPNIQVTSSKIKNIRNNKQPEYKDDNQEIDPVIIYIKSKLTIKDLLEEWGVNTRLGRNCECPFHSSESGQCFSYDIHQFHCFHCNRGGSMFDLAMEYYEKDFMAVKNLLAEKVGVPENIKREAMALAIRAKKAEMTEYLVNKFMNNNKVYTIRNSIKPEMWIYNNGIYIPHGETYIIQFCRALLNEFFSTHAANQVIAKIRADTYINEELFFNVNYEFEIPVENGILNITTKKIANFNPEKIFFNKLPVFYDIKQNNCENIMGFLNTTLENPEDIQVLKEACGYILWKNCKLKKAFMLIGDGDNGKSVFLDLLSVFLGTQNISNISLHDLDNDDWSPAGLFGKMANINADVSGSKLTDSNIFKKIVAGDDIDAKRKFLNPIKFKNFAKCFFAVNNMPESEDKSDGFFTRWIVVNFPYIFKSAEDYEYLSDENKQSGKYKIADPFIIDKLTTEKELSGFLNWILDGFQIIKRNRKFSVNPIIEEIKHFWERKENSMKAFVEDRLNFTYKMEDYVFASDVQFEYNKYWRENKLKQVNKKEYMSVLEGLPINYSRKKISTGGNSFMHKRIWTGVKFKNDIN